MNGPFTTLAGVVALVLGFSVVWTADDILAPDAPPFMAVNSISYEDGFVRVSRTISGLDEPADWDVVIYKEGSGAPICKTLAGPNEGQGWSYYEPGFSEKTMPLDLWVGDYGCLSRLTPGLYGMNTTWTPRDKSPVVRHHHEFIVHADALR